MLLLNNTTEGISEQKSTYLKTRVFGATAYLWAQINDTGILGG